MKSIEILRFGKIHLLISCLMVYSSMHCQSSISGRVFDAKTDKPIKGANVYLLGTLKGAATNDEGMYTIPNLPTNTFYIIVSHIGYASQKKSIVIRNNQKLKQNFFLDEKLFELPQVTVLDDKQEWVRNLNIFKNQFIGVLKNSQFTEIINPYIISFYTDENGWLNASADSAIIIENNILGYQIKYFLDDFKHFYPTTLFAGQPFFREIVIKGKSENKFSEYRKKSYCGSLRHFLSTSAKQYIQDSIMNKGRDEALTKSDTVLNSLLSLQGFKVYSQNSLNAIGPVRPIYYPVNMSQFFKIAEDSAKLIFSFPELLRIHYVREVEDDLYLTHIGLNKTKIKSKMQISLIELSADSVVLDQTGYFLDKMKIHTYGYWAYDRLANMLPYEYELPDSTLEKYYESQ